MKVKKSPGSRIADVFIHIFLVIFALATFLPFFSIIAGSLASAEENARHPFLLWPREPTLDTYRYLFSSATMPRAMMVSIYVTLIGTAVNILMTTLMAWPLAHQRIHGRKTMMFFITVTMIFSGGMIPNYFIVRATGLLDSFMALVIPGAIGTFNLILMKNFFQGIPASLEESAKLDGCNDFVILTRIVIPLSLAAIATFTLFYAVGHWNSFMPFLLYIPNPKKWNLQIMLRQIVMLYQGGVGDSESVASGYLVPPQGVKMAAIVFSTFPILCVYPLLQKYFTKGVMVGSIKG